MFKIIASGAKGHRVEADTVLTPADFQSIGEQMGVRPVRVKKIGYVAARKATKREVVETRSDGRETTNTARAGDFIVTNLSAQREPLRDRDGQLNRYVIDAARFAALYSHARAKSSQGPIYRARGAVSALPLPGGFEITAPWGEQETSASGYLLCNGKEVYGSSWDAFKATYEVLEAKRRGSPKR
jgi:hypothetical protein